MGQLRASLCVGIFFLEFSCASPKTKPVEVYGPTFPAGSGSQNPANEKPPEATPSEPTFSEICIESLGPSAGDAFFLQGVLESVQKYLGKEVKVPVRVLGQGYSLWMAALFAQPKAEGKVAWVLFQFSDADFSDEAIIRQKTQKIESGLSAPSRSESETKVIVPQCSTETWSACTQNLGRVRLVDRCKVDAFHVLISPDRSGSAPANVALTSQAAGISRSQARYRGTRQMDEAFKKSGDRLKFKAQ